ncbi:uncharacterized protein LOC136082608 [Hydra vulgaris]|uniref:Uncharacterized protein LOC136082608 n=1 Tax=Hydra vulgaris TaxID=6087 RepID=A0ABM4C901_HYDVU
MKVNLASQIFSSSDADVLHNCSQNLKLPQFKGCNTTVKFIRTIDHLFHSALRVCYKPMWFPFLYMANNYILFLKDATGNRIISSSRKTVFIGFLIATKSVQGIFS